MFGIFATTTINLLVIRLANDIPVLALNVVQLGDKASQLSPFVTEA